MTVQPTRTLNPFTAAERWPGNARVWEKWLRDLMWADARKSRQPAGVRAMIESAMEAGAEYTVADLAGITKSSDQAVWEALDAMRRTGRAASEKVDGINLWRLA